MGSVIQRVRPNHFSKTKVYIYEIRFHKYMMNNFKRIKPGTQELRCSNSQSGSLHS